MGTHDEGRGQKKKRGEKERIRDMRTIPETISSDYRNPLLRAAVKHNDLAPKNDKRRSDAEIHAHQHSIENAIVVATSLLKPISFENGKKLPFR